MSLINVTNLTFAYDGSYDNIFEDVSFQLDTDWKLGFTGRNGRGKTTFLNLLMGKYEFNGSISASVKFEYFPYDAGQPDDFTIDVAESVCGVNDWRLMKELNQLAVDADVLYRPFSTLSEGERTKVLLAALFLRENSFLLIDEPTNHLDAAAREIVSEYLNRKKGFILVSHDRTFLDGCIDHILTINKTSIEIQRGNFSSWYKNKTERDNFEAAENEKLKGEIKHLTDAAKRASDWSDIAEKRKNGQLPSKIEVKIARRSIEGRKSKKMMARSKAIETRREEAVEEKTKLLKDVERSDSLKISPLPYYTDQLVALENVSVFYSGRTVCENVSFTVREGDRIALCGRNGCGKSSVLKLICGEDISYTGNLLKNGRLKISCVGQSTAALSGSLSDYAKSYGIDENLFRAILCKLDVPPVQFEKDLSNYSGGQKKKVLIARSLSEQAHLYIWDEPLNFIDVISRMQIEELLKKYRPTMIFVEHDRAFCDDIASGIIEM